MSAGLNPLDKVVNVEVIFTAGGIAPQDFGKTLFITPDETLPTTNRLQTFTSFSEVQAVFPENSEPYTAGLIYFSRTDGQPKAFMVGRWFKTQTQAQLVGGTTVSPLTFFQAISAGEFDVVIGTTTYEVKGLDFTTATTYADVASTITTGLNAEGLVATCIFQNGVFVVNGDPSTPLLNYFSPAGSPVGTDIAVETALTEATAQSLSQQVGPETISECFAELQALDNTFYFVTLDVSERDQATQVELSTVINASSRPYLFYAESADQTLANFNTFVAQETSRVAGDYMQVDANTPTGFTKYLTISSCASLSLTNFNATNGIVNNYLTTRPEIAYSNLTENQINEFNTKGINYLINFGGGSQSSTVAPYYLNGTTFQQTIFQDIRFGVDWLQNLLQVAIFDVLATSRYIPRTTEGQTIIITTINNELEQAVRFGLAASGQLSPEALSQYRSITGDQSFDGFLSKGYTVYAPPFTTETEINRANRAPAEFYAFVKGSGAINGVNLVLYFDQ